MKKYKKLVAAVLGISLMGIAVYGLASANAKKTAEATNVVTVGAVNIALYMEKEEKDGMVKVQPEEEIANQIVVENVGKYPAYVRVKVQKEWKAYHSETALNAEQLEQLSLPDERAIALDYDETLWNHVQENGEDYYYYNKVLPAGKAGSVMFSPSYKILTEKEAGDGLLSNEVLQTLQAEDVAIDGDIKVVAEAIQADEVTPELDSSGAVTGWPLESEAEMDPIPDVDIKTDATPAAEVIFEKNKIVLKNEADGDFLDISGIMPGQTVSRLICIKNQGERELPVYLYAITEEPFSGLSQQERELLQSLQLLVTRKDGTVLYTGPLFDEDASKEMLNPEIPVLLGNLQEGEAKELYVAVKCPQSWTKPDTKVKVLWVFDMDPAQPEETEEPQETAEPEETPKPQETEKAQESSKPQKTVTPTREVYQLPEAPQGTGKKATDQPVKTKNSAETPKPTAGKSSAKPVKPEVKPLYPTKTGDATPIVFWSILCIGSLAGVLYGAWKKNGGGKRR